MHGEVALYCTKPRMQSWEGIRKSFVPESKEAFPASCLGFGALETGCSDTKQILCRLPVKTKAQKFMQLNPCFGLWPYQALFIN